jgi:hypothetical protein
VVSGPLAVFDPPLTPEEEAFRAAIATAVASYQEHLGFPPKINKADLAERLRSGGELYQQERELLADMLEGKSQNPPHHPRSLVKAINNDGIVRLVFLYEAMGQRVLQKTIADRCGVSDRHVREVFEKLDPEREKTLRAWAADFVAWLHGDHPGTTVIDVLTELTKWK